MGTNHSTAITCICAECMIVNEKFAEENPEIAKRIKEYCGV